MPRVLIVEDDKLFREMLFHTLEGAGYEVVAAENGKEAVEGYFSYRADVVLTDLLMPEKEGIETIIELRRIDPAVKIVAMTGGGRTEPEMYLKMARNLGANQALTKPFSDEALFAALKAALQGNGQ